MNPGDYCISGGVNVGRRLGVKSSADQHPRLGDEIAISLIRTRNSVLITIGEGIAKIAAEVQLLNGEYEHGRTN